MSHTSHSPLRSGLAQQELNPHPRNSYPAAGHTRARTHTHASTHTTQCYWANVKKTEDYQGFEIIILFSSLHLLNSWKKERKNQSILHSQRAAWATWTHTHRTAGEHRLKDWLNWVSGVCVWDCVFIELHCLHCLTVHVLRTVFSENCKLYKVTEVALMNCWD